MTVRCLPESRFGRVECMGNILPPLLIVGPWARICVMS